MITLTGRGLSIEDLVSVARDHQGVEIGDDALERVDEARAQLEERIAAGETMYGVNTGVGANEDEVISASNIRAFQRNLLRSHAFGVGEALPEDAVRGMMLLRLNSLLSGNSGIRTEVVARLRDMLNGGIWPRVPRKGSVSSSGDLAPLAHLGLVMTGEGEARVGDEWVSGEAALREAGIEPISLEAKEGLAIVNGTNLVTALGALAVHDARRLADAADTVGALSLEANRGIVDPFREEVQALRGHPGQATSARRVRELCEGSELVGPSEEKPEVQNEYSLRCIPQVHGATRDVIDWVADTIEREMNAVTDNPLVLDSGAVVSGGNFHAQPVALALDSLAIALAELANISERRVFHLTEGEDARDVEGPALPPFLVGDEDVDAGLNSGFMIPQVTAAALVSENKTLASPDAVDSIPTSANQEDHVSMGANAANHLLEVVENAETVLAIECFAAYQALSHRERDPGAGTRALRDAIAEEVAPVTRDRILVDDLDTVRDVLFEAVREDP